MPKNYAIPDHVIAASAEQEKQYRGKRYTQAELDEATLHALQDDPHVSALINDPDQLSKAVDHMTSAEKAKLEAAEKRAEKSRQRELKNIGSEVEGNYWKNMNARGRKLYKTRNKKSRRGRRSKRSRRTRRSRK
jgi:hypothetical protein